MRTLALADYLVLNETEAAAITGYSPSAPEQAGEALLPAGNTAAQPWSSPWESAAPFLPGRPGVPGAWFPGGGHRHPGAGDTFFGVFTASLYVGLSPEQALHRGEYRSRPQCSGQRLLAQISFPGIEAIDRQWKTQFKRLSSENAGTPPSP